METFMATHRFALPLTVFAVATMMSAACPAKDDAREAAVKAAELARFAANVQADAPALNKLLDDGLEYTHSNGDLDSKQTFIDSLTSGKRDYVSTAADIESVRIFGEVAIIRGKAKVTVSTNGKSQDLHIGYTDVWLWKDGRWQMTAWRSARLPDSPVK
jgi:hypothetical protein